MAAASFWRCIVNSAANNETIEIPTNAKPIFLVINEMMDSLAQKGFRTVVRVAGRMVILSRLLAQFEKGFTHNREWSPSILRNRLWPEDMVPLLFSRSRLAVDVFGDSHRG